MFFQAREQRFALGAYTFALSKGSGDPVDGAPVTVPSGSSTIEGTYQSRAVRRWIGFGALVGGVGAGLTLGLIGGLQTTRVCDPDCRDAHEPNLTLVGIGGGLMVAGVIAILILDRADEATFRVIPGVSSSLPTSLSALSIARRAEHDVGVAPGLTLSMKW